LVSQFILEFFLKLFGKRYPRLIFRNPIPIHFILKFFDKVFRKVFELEKYNTNPTLSLKFFDKGFRKFLKFRKYNTSLLYP